MSTYLFVILFVLLTLAPSVSHSQADTDWYAGVPDGATMPCYEELASFGTPYDLYTLHDRRPHDVARLKDLHHCVEERLSTLEAIRRQSRGKAEWVYGDLLTYHVLAMLASKQLLAVHYGAGDYESSTSKYYLSSYISNYVYATQIARWFSNANDPPLERVVLCIDSECNLAYAHFLAVFVFSE